MPCELNRRSFVRQLSRSACAVSLGALITRRARALGRSLPPFPTAEEMYGWAADVVSITNRHKQYRRSGSAGDAEVRRYIADRLRDFGIPQVEDQIYRFSRHVYESWSLTAGGREIDCFFWRDSAFTSRNGLAADLVYVGDGIPDDGSVVGKIVVLDVRPGEIHAGQLAAISDYVHDPQGFFQDAKALSAPNLSTNMPAAFYRARAAGAVGRAAVCPCLVPGTELGSGAGLATDKLCQPRQYLLKKPKS